MLLTVSILCVVTFMAGLIDSIAGGGGLLRLPALLVAGVPPQQALGTNKFVGAIGTGAAMLNFARKGLILWKLALVGVPCALLGSAAGSKCILAFDPQTAGKILIALLPVLTSTGKGADIMVPMAIPTFGGMLIQSMTMFVVPVFQCWWREGLLKKEEKARNAAENSSPGK